MILQFSEVPCNDKSYHWMLDWVTKVGARKTQHLSVRTRFDENGEFFLVISMISDKKEYF